MFSSACLKFFTARAMPSSSKPIKSFWYSIFTRHWYRALVPVTFESSPPPKKRGITAANRAWNLPLKSVKQRLLIAFSSVPFNLASPLPESAHIEYELAQFMIIQNPHCHRVDDTLELAVIPLRNFISDEQRFVVPERLRNVHGRHSHQQAHNQILQPIRPILIPEKECVNRLPRTVAQLIQKLHYALRLEIIFRIRQPVNKQHVTPQHR